MASGKSLKLRNIGLAKTYKKFTGTVGSNQSRVVRKAALLEFRRAARARAVANGLGARGMDR